MNPNEQPQVRMFNENGEPTNEALRSGEEALEELWERFKQHTSYEASVYPSICNDPKELKRILELDKTAARAELIAIAAREDRDLPPNHRY